MSHTNSSKRKKSETLDDDDDILALATPAKKERSSPPTPKHPSVEKPSASMSITIPKAQPHKNTKKEKLSEPKHPISAIEVPPKASNKGKEKEVAIQPPIPAIPPKAKKPPVIQATPINEKKCKELLRVLQKIPEAAIFSRPVNPVLDGCPTYVASLSPLHVAYRSLGTWMRLPIQWTLEPCHRSSLTINT